MSNCPYLVTCPDITFTLFMQAGQISVKHHHVEDDFSQAAAGLALRLNALLLGLTFWLLGKLHVMAALRYLPYPVVAGFLAMIGAAVVKGAFIILLSDPDNESRYFSTVVSIAFASCVLGLKLKGIRTSFSAPVLILSLLAIFYGWAFCTGRAHPDLAKDRVTRSDMRVSRSKYFQIQCRNLGTKAAASSGPPGRASPPSFWLWLPSSCAH
eukprot:g11233.t1